MNGTSRRLFDFFVGDIVSIILDQQVEHTIEKTNSVQTMKSPLSVQGYVLDMDDEYVYLGHSPDQISQAVKIDFIVHIETAKEENPINKILNEIDTPDKPEGYN